MTKLTGIPLFTPPAPPEALAALDKLPRALDKVLPVRGKHAKALPFDVKRLSELLTSERGNRPKGYLADAPVLSAYLRAFLPWNLVRLCRLLPNLDLRRSPASPSGAVIVDLGAGPLTFGLALWLARLTCGTNACAWSAWTRWPRPCGPDGTSWPAWPDPNPRGKVDTVTGGVGHEAAPAGRSCWSRQHPERT